MKIVALIVMFISFGTQYTVAQCAMCRTQLENNVSNGEIGIAAGINFGILYLLSMPYLAVLVIGYFWYRNSRKYGKQKLEGGIT